MNKITCIIVGLVALLYCGNAIGAERLTGEQAKTLLVGKTIYGVLKGKDFEKTFHEDGKITGFVGEKEYKSKWYMLYSKFCHDTRKGTKCAIYEKEGDQINIFKENGKYVGSFKVKE